MKQCQKKMKSEPEPKPHAIIKGVQAGCKYLQSSWADWMRRNTEKISRRTWMVLLILFVLLTGSYNVYCLINAFTGRGYSITVTPIQKPKYATKKEPYKAMVVPKEEYRRIKKFRKYMDSLAQSPSGKILYDRIISRRPGLLDSVRLIEHYYQNYY